LAAAIESGEKLYPNTATDGREIVRQQLRALKQDWDGLYDEVMSTQRHLEINLVQWTSFEESCDQVETWLGNLEGQLQATVPVHATLEEKKAQLQSYRVGCYLLQS
jgi:nesprin-1